MSKDYKIGVVIGLFILIFGISYFLITGGKDDDRATVRDDAAGKKEELVFEDDLSNSHRGMITDRDISRRGRSLSELQSREYGVDMVHVDYEKQDSDTGKKAQSTILENKIEGKDGVRVSLEEEKVIREKVSEKIGFTFDRLDGKKVELENTVAKKAEDSGVGTYKVKAGDNGFWDIAQKVYGNGKYWKKIQEANPGVSTTALRKGKILRIPELQKTTATKSAAVSVAQSDYGKVVNVDGKRYYIVSSSDSSGLWGIAARKDVYGRGRLYTLLKSANPNIDTTKLRAGMKLLVPPAPMAETREEPKTGKDNKTKKSGRYFELAGEPDFG